jgi:alpha/beta superfamily hydrolase
MNHFYTKLRASVVALLLLASTIAKAQTPNICSPRYEADVFPTFTTSTVAFGAGLNYLGSPTILNATVYQPTGDTMSARPLAIVLFAGSFTSGSRNDAYVVQTCTTLVKKGYVAAAIDYRTGMSSPTEIAVAIYRAVQDCNQSIRFFRANKNTYKIDTANIELIGFSAGAVTAMHSVFWDQSEVPSAIPTAFLGNLNAGTSQSESHKVRAVYAAAGGIGDLNWLSCKQTDVYLYHNNTDPVVPYGAGNFALLPFYGSSEVKTTLDGFSSMPTSLLNPAVASMHLPVGVGQAAQAVQLLGDITGKTLQALDNPPVWTIENCAAPVKTVYNGKPIKRLFLRGAVYLHSYDFRLSDLSLAARGYSNAPSGTIKFIACGTGNNLYPQLDLTNNNGVILPASYTNPENAIVVLDGPMTGIGAPFTAVNAPSKLRGLKFLSTTNYELGLPTNNYPVSILALNSSASNTLSTTKPIAADILIVNGCTFNVNNNAVTLGNPSSVFGSAISPALLTYNTGILSNVNAANFSSNIQMNNSLRSASGRGAWLNVGSPFSGTNIQQFSEAGNLTFTPNATSSYSAYSYNGQNSGSSVWEPITNPNENLSNGTGYHIWFRDSFFTSAQGRLLLNGMPNTNNTASGNLAFNSGASNWYLLANPFLKTVDLSSTDQFTASNIEDGFAIYRSNIRAFAQWSPTFSINGGTSKIAPCQGLFLPSKTASANNYSWFNSANSSTTFNTSLAANTELYSALLEQASTANLRVASAATAGTISIQLNGDEAADETIVRLENNASTAQVQGEDLVKMQGAEVSLYSQSSNGVALAGNTWNPTSGNDLIELRFRAPAGNYNLRLATAPVLGTAVRLVDFATNERTPLSADGVFNVSFTVTEADAATFQNRFALELNNVTTANSAISKLVNLFPNPAKDVITLVTPNATSSVAEILDVRGVVVKTITLNETTSNTLSITDLKTGIYTLRTSVNGERIVKMFSKQ